MMMAKRNVILLGVLVALAVATAGAYLYFTGSSLVTEDSQDQPVLKEARNLSGRVVTVNVEENSFVILQEAEKRSFTVQLGEDTVFSSLSFPFDITEALPGTSFTPVFTEATVADLVIGDQVFVRPVSPVNTGDSIINPLEVQILP